MRSSLTATKPIWLKIGFAITLMCILSDSRLSANDFVRLQYNLFSTEQNALNTVFIELFDDRPLTRDNFLQYVDAGLFDDTIMHRLARDFVLQGGSFYPEFVDEPPPLNVSLDPTALVDLDGNPATGNPTVMNEFGNSPPRLNTRGTLAMAKLANNPNSATNGWFFNIVDNPSLDTQNGGFTAFAQVVGNGMDLVDLYNSSLGITNFNPDTNNDGIRESGPFYRNSNDGVPFGGGNLLNLQVAERVRYLGAGGSTTVLNTGLTFTGMTTFIDHGHDFAGSTSGRLIVNVNTTLGTASDLSLSRRLNILGTLEVGLQLGTLTTTSYQQKSTGELRLQLLGTTVGEQYDSLIVNGLAQLDGTLTVELIPGYRPNQDDTFTLVQATSFMGDFATYDLPVLTGGLQWLAPEKTATSIAITVGGVLGDYNYDGVVDAADYTVVRDNFGSFTELQADGNGNGIIEFNDFLVWRQNFGGIATTGSLLSGGGGQVPEPRAAALLVLMVSLFGLTQKIVHR